MGILLFRVCNILVALAFILPFGFSFAGSFPKGSLVLFRDKENNYFEGKIKKVLADDIRLVSIKRFNGVVYKKMLETVEIDRLIIGKKYKKQQIYKPDRFLKLGDNKEYIIFAQFEDGTLRLNNNKYSRTGEYTRAIRYHDASKLKRGDMIFNPEYLGYAKNVYLDNTVSYMLYSSKYILGNVLDNYNHLPQYQVNFVKLDQLLLRQRPVWKDESHDKNNVSILDLSEMTER